MSLIQVNQKDQVVYIQLSRPEKKNALTREMYQLMADALDKVQQDASVKVVCIRGEGQCFTAGNDIGDFASKKDTEHVSETAAFMRALASCKKPVVAQVEGMAVGIGTTLLLHCDLVYSAPDTKFVLPFINLGLVPEYASSYLLPRLAGHRKASEWLMLGEPFSAEEAKTFGIITDIVDGEHLDAHVERICSKLAAKPAFSLNHTKSLMRNDDDAVMQQMNEELDVFIEAMNTEAAQEAFDAFLNKRPINPEKFK
ncbi:enoyl-CoA hydratase [Alteromonas halophila]|uniref:Enoyl-CoA hydratase n=1 Tax=Alteromonas halophila TaxID=516698 RepID=A0A918JQU9_9ALTE|nr:enoyl-CoA hydratase [Alteromonas halophila]GGW95676.1 enoyl-CoA hydratase [Alteromonas halophila]